MRGQPRKNKPPRTTGRTPRDKRLIDGLQRVNGQYSSVLQWVGLLGFLYGVASANPVLISAFGGLIPLSLVVGKK